MTSEQTRPDARRFGRSAGLASAGIGLSGLLLYGFFALASHTLSREEYGEIVVLWLIVFAIVSTLFRPVEQLLARELAAARARGESESRALRSAALILGGTMASFLLAALLFGEPLRDHVFSGDEVLFWSLIGGVVSFGGDYFVRGVLAGRGRFDIYAAQLVTECSVLVLAGVLAAAGLSGGLHAFAVAIAIAPLLGLAVAGTVALSSRAPRAEAGRRDGAGAGLARHGGFAAAVLLIMLSEQVLINSGPLFVRAAEGSALAGFVFNLLMVARAPAALFQGVAASLLPHLSAARAAGGEEGERAFRDALSSTVAGVAAFTALTICGLLAIGPQVMQAVFGDNFSYGRGELVLIAAGMGCLLTASTLTQASLVRGRALLAAAVWVGAALCFLAWNLVGTLPAETLVKSGFAVITAVLALALFLVLRTKADAELELLPGSPDELQARLAASEELG